MSVSTTETDPIEAVIDILQGIDSSRWRNADPTVQRHNKVPQSQKGPGNDQAPELYVWQPTDAEITQFGSKWNETDEQFTVEIRVWSLSNSETWQYMEDIRTIFDSYANDNERRTQFHRLRPTLMNDIREQNPPRKTSYYVGSVEIDLRRLREAYSPSDTDTEFEIAFEGAFIG